MSQMRSTVVLAGAILGRFKEAKFSYPGGCDIGARPIDLHLSAFKKLGVNITEDSGFIICKADKIIGTNIDLDFPSVGATENIILASIYAEGITQITNAAMEPEIVDLAKCLNKMGAKITGAGTNIIKITGVQKLKDIGYKVMQDRIEAGTLLCAGAITGGNICLNYRTPEHITPILNKLEEAGCDINIEKNKVYMQAPKKMKAVDIKTMPYPGFPTDLGQPMSVLLTQANGISLFEETIWENRMGHVKYLNQMGANIEAERQHAKITGPTKLHGEVITATDLRAGAALVTAGLLAEGTTIINDAEHILRGYERIINKLSHVGANIKIEEI